MATPRSATTAHKRMRARVIADAKARGVTHCPACDVELDYDAKDRPPNAPEADEIVSFSQRGFTSTDPADWQVLCRRCNQRKGKGWTASGQPLEAAPFPHSRPW